MCAPQIKCENGMDHKWDMLVDTGSSFTSTMNLELLDNVIHNPEGLNMNTNAGRKSTNKRGHVVGLNAKAWTDEDGAANVFSFADLADQCHVTHDKADENAFTVQSWEDDQDNDGNLKFPRGKTLRLCSHRFSTECANRNESLMHNEQDLEEIKHSE